MNVIAAFDEKAIIWITLYMGKQDCPFRLPPPPIYLGNETPQLCREQVAFHKASVLLLIGEAWSWLHMDKG